MNVMEDVHGIKAFVVFGRYLCLDKWLGDARALNCR